MSYPEADVTFVHTDNTDLVSSITRAAPEQRRPARPPAPPVRPLKGAPRGKSKINIVGASARAFSVLGLRPSRGAFASCVPSP
ncbi:MAG TPA: hypothetical protein VJ386_03705 [Candidatus Deferrimicrobiaceae bacterium]|nr:hypothetical protein [Candidatus Deferrimicrobiaceae bacterium]